MGRLSCNVSQKKGGFPVQIGVLVQEEKKRKKLSQKEVSAVILDVQYFNLKTGK